MREPLARKTFDFDADVANFRVDKNAKQVKALEALDSGLIKFLLYGGAMGPGKSYFLRWFAVRFLIRLFQDRGMRNVAVMLACEDYPSLKDRQLVKIGSEFPQWLGQSFKDHGDYGRCFMIYEGYGGGVVCFRNLDDPSKYASAEFAAILIDELTKNNYQTFVDLKTRLRWPGLKDIECPFVCATNPGGIGHGWVKQLWIDKQFPLEWIRPIDYRSQFAYIPGTADDNPYLDQSYWDSLNTLPEQQRRAYRYGDWNIFKGQAFPEVNKVAHGYRPAAVAPPPGVWVAMAMDWGFGAPFSIGWYHTDADGRLYRFGSWYGWNGTANEGLRLEDSLIATGIKEREKDWGLTDRVAVRVLSPDCFQKKPDYKGGGQGPSTAEVFRQCGMENIHPGDPSRKLKIRQFRERVNVPKDGTAPMLLVNEDDEHFFRTVGSIITAENDPEEIDTKGEDHVFDECAFMVMARPLSSRVIEIQVIRRPPSGGSEAAQLERQAIMEKITESEHGGDLPW